MITSRVADASLTLAPAVHEFDWNWNDWPRLAAATAAGHLIECGAQVTGGLWCNWRPGRLSDLAGVGYPIAEIDADGSFTITKPPGTGGAVNLETVSEQLLYEVGDPAVYLTPDVVADFTSLALTETGRDAVRLTNARGRPATDSYKVSIAYRDGFMASGTLVIAGPDAQAKGRFCGEVLLERLRRVGIEPQFSHIECLGSGECFRRARALLECTAGLSGSDIARGGARRTTRSGGTFHERVRPASDIRAARRERLHDRPADRARGIRLLAGAAGEGRGDAAGRYISPAPAPARKCWLQEVAACGFGHGGWRPCEAKTASVALTCFSISR